MRMLVLRARKRAALRNLRIDALWMDREAVEQTFTPGIEALVPNFKYTVAKKNNTEPSSD